MRFDFFFFEVSICNRAIYITFGDRSGQITERAHPFWVVLNAFHEQVCENSVKDYSVMKLFPSSPSTNCIHLSKNVAWDSPNHVAFVTSHISPPLSF